MDIKYVVNASDIIEKTLFGIPYRKTAFDYYYKPSKVENCVSAYYFIRTEFEEIILRNFFYITKEGFERLKKLFHDYNLERCFEPIEAQNAEMNIINAISDYYRIFTDCVKDIPQKTIENLNSFYNVELAKHISYLMDLKLGKVENLEFEGYDGLKKFIQAVYFLSQKIDEETLSDMVFYSNLVNSDMSLLFNIEKEKILQFSKLTLFCPSGMDLSQEIEEYEYLTINFSLLSPYYSIEELLKFEEIRKLVEIYKAYYEGKTFNLDYNILDFLVSVFVDNREDYLKLKKLYYYLWKNALTKT